MSVHYDKSRKSWYVRYREYDLEGTSKNRIKRGFPTKREASRWETEKEESKIRVTFEQLKNDYIHSLNGYANQETIQSKERSLNKYAASLFKMDIHDIDRKTLLAWTNDLLNTDLSVIGKNRIITYVKAVSKFGYMTYDYVDFAKSLKRFPKSSRDIKGMTIISPIDFENFSQNVPNLLYRAFYVFLYHTGVRRGEAMALLKTDIVGNVATINKSMRRGIIGPLKNVSSIRTIILDKYVLDVLAHLMTIEGPYLFGGQAPLSATNVLRYFHLALEKTGLPKMRLHDLRHSFVSNAIGAGTDIVTVSKFVGHANTQQTLNTYSHLIQNNKITMIKDLEDIYKK